MFQSAPAIAGGRTVSARVRVLNKLCFNPRPPLLAGEPLADDGDALRLAVFQSTPAIAGGRTRDLQYG